MHDADEPRACSALYDNPNLDLGAKSGVKVSLPVRYLLDTNWSLAVNPWFETSGLGQSPRHVVNSTTGMYVYEPESSTSILGATLSVRWTI